MKRWRQREKLKDSFLSEGAALFKDLRRLLAAAERWKKNADLERKQFEREARTAVKRLKAAGKKASGCSAGNKRCTFSDGANVRKARRIK